jgi:hypothetical protein
VGMAREAAGKAILPRLASVDLGSR